MPGMTIGQAAARSGCTPATIRFYEEQGLLRGIARAANGRRVYGWPDVQRLRFIRRCRDFGFALPEIGALVRADAQGPDCLAVRDLAVSHAARLNRMRQEIEALETTLSAMAETCNAACAVQRSAACSIVEDMFAQPSG